MVTEELLDNGGSTYFNYNAYNAGPSDTVFYDDDQSGKNINFTVWQSTGRDNRSELENPDFVSNTDLYTSNGILSGAGIADPNITDDIDGNLRPNPPCIGANEVNFLKIITTDMAIAGSRCIDSSISFSANSSSYDCGSVNKWHWSFGDSLSRLSGKDTSTAQNPTHIYKYAGNYTVWLKTYSSGGCSDSVYENIFVDSICAVKLGIKAKLNKASDIKLYPNPASTSLTIESSANLIQSITVFDATGKQVYQSENLKAQNQSVPVNNLPSGIYIVKIGLDNGSYMAKFMKE